LLLFEIIWTTKGTGGKPQTRRTQRVADLPVFPQETATLQDQPVKIFVSFVPEASGFFVSEASDLCGPKLKLK